MFLRFNDFLHENGVIGTKYYQVAGSAATNTCNIASNIRAIMSSITQDTIINCLTGGLELQMKALEVLLNFL